MSSRELDRPGQAGRWTRRRFLQVGALTGAWVLTEVGLRVPASAAPPEARSLHPLVDVMATSAQGYVLVAADGGAFAFGDATFHGSTADIVLNAGMMAGARTPTGNGYWLTAGDGGVFAFGDAGFHGSLADHQLNQPIVGIAPTPSGNGYWLTAGDGGVFALGDAGFHGSLADHQLNQPIVGIAPTPSGNGYWLAAGDGGVFALGDAQYLGRAVWTPPPPQAGDFHGADRFIPAHPNNYKVANRGPAEIERIVIHTIEGSEASGISTFQSPAKPVSAHYIVAKSGRITQMVHDKDIAYHVYDNNHDTIGIEHEGFAADPNHPEELYRRSAALARYLCDRYGIAPDRSGILAHSELDPTRRSDPGAGWDWDHYIDLINS
jgi:N-acetylmuramoyl-L-alanine amidase